MIFNYDWRCYVVTVAAVSTWDVEWRQIARKCFLQRFNGVLFIGTQSIWLSCWFDWWWCRQRGRPEETGRIFDDARTMMDVWSITFLAEWILYSCVGLCRLVVKCWRQSAGYHERPWARSDLPVASSPLPSIECYYLVRFHWGVWLPASNHRDTAAIIQSNRSPA